MTVSARTPLGASTNQRKYYLDVDTTPDATDPTWVGVFGITELQFAIDPTLQDDSDYDSGGYKSQTKTAEAWSVTGKVARKVQVDDLTAYDPGQEYLRAKGIGTMGVANSVHIRIYEMEPNGPREEAYEGNAAVSWAPDGGPMDALSLVSFTLSGQGQLEEIAHPGEVGAGTPVVAALSDQAGAAAGGELVIITGTNLTGATSVKFGATNATDFEVINSNKIAAVVPAHSAGTVAVTVVTPAGTSPANPTATDYVYS